MSEDSGASPARLNSAYERTSLGTRIIMAVFLSIALYNGLELIILVLSTFSRYRGLYFWSLLLSTVLGVIPATIGALLDFFRIGPVWLSVTLSNLGWCFMVPGQSFVLYSRLHLVSDHFTALRYLRYLIIIASIALVIPAWTLYAGATYIPTKEWNKGYSIVEKLQVTWFCLQECLISGFYILETVKMIRLSPERDRRRRKILNELLAINFLAILMDVALMSLEYLGLYFAQVILKSPVYSIKLKLEFFILGKLILLATSHSPGHNLTESPGYVPQTLSHQTTPTQYGLSETTTNKEGPSVARTEGRVPAMESPYPRDLDFE